MFYCFVFGFIFLAKQGGRDIETEEMLEDLHTKIGQLEKQNKQYKEKVCASFYCLCDVYIHKHIHMSLFSLHTLKLELETVVVGDVCLFIALSYPAAAIVVLEHEWAFLWTEMEHVWHCFIFGALCAEIMTTCKTCSISVHKNNHEWSNTIIIFQN